MKRHLLLGKLMIAALMVAGCDRMNFQGTEVGRRMVADNAREFDEKLGNAVFSLVRGETRAEAVGTLTADGATCIEAVCIWGYVKTIDWRDSVGFGPGYDGCSLTDDSRACRQWIIYQVTLGAPVINERSQISASIDQGIDRPSDLTPPGASTR